MRPGLACLSVALSGDETPPTEFRLFVRGENPTKKGTFLFDDAAAASVMAEYRQWGVDLAIDLEHQMLGKAPSPDPTSRDARGWCQLELRDDGSLWAVGVRWTPDGAARLIEKRQRYVSPAFAVDSDTRRITQVVNIAITAMPATHNTPALVAASVTSGEKMDPKLIAEALDALVAGDTAKCAELLKSIIASAAGAAPAKEEAPPPPEVTAVTPAAEKPEDAAVAASRLMSLSGATTLVSAVAEIEVWRTSHLTLESERQKLAAERALQEAAKRRELAVELVKLGAEFPSTVWADDAASKLKTRWLSMPIADFVAHVAEQRAARGDKAAAGKGLPPTASTVTLSARELAMCTEKKIDPKDYAARKAAARKA